MQRCNPEKSNGEVNDKVIWRKGIVSSSEVLEEMWQKGAVGCTVCKN